MRTAGRVVGATLLAACVASACSTTREAPAQTGSVPRAQDGKPDLTGVYQTSARRGDWDFDVPGEEPGVPAARPAGTIAAVQRDPVPYQDWARIKAQETLSGLSEDADVRALANVREHIDQLARNADPGMVDSEGKSVRPTLARLDAKTKEANARAQLEAMKAARGKREDPPLAIVESPEGEEPEEPTPPPEKEIKRTL